ncbi:MAG TPA: hypothetical protein VGC85_08980 [Chthoniobacterales bacterium]
MLPFRSSRVRNAAFGLLFAGVVCLRVALADDPSASPQKKQHEHTSLTSLPLPIGHEAKGLVLPDIDTEGHLRTRFEAGTAKRTDVEHVDFTDLRLTTFTAENTRDLFIEMPTSTMNLETRAIQSHARTTVSRSDFKIEGDRMQFDTLARKGTLVGNVKMVITDNSAQAKKKAE